MDNQKHIEEDHQRAKFWDKVFSGGVGLGGGYLAAYKTIHDQFEADIRNSPHFQEVHRSHGHELGELLEGFLDPSKWNPTHPQNVGKPAPANLEDYTKRVQDAKGRHPADYDVLHAKGVYAKGWKAHTVGIWRKFRLLGGDSKWATSFNSLVAATVAAGATYTFFNNVRNRREIVDLKKALDEHESQRDRSR